jgi:hypothetical protein
LDCRPDHGIHRKNFRLRRFVYSTPFTEDGKQFGELNENFIRKTILTVANTFPYVKTRISVVDRQACILWGVGRSMTP